MKIYEQEIDKMANSIIEEKDYSTLKSILRNYDKLVKSYYLKKDEQEKLPFWCYCCYWSRGEKIK